MANQICEFDYRDLALNLSLTAKLKVLEGQLLDATFEIGASIDHRVQNLFRLELLVKCIHIVGIDYNLLNLKLLHLASMFNARVQYSRLRHDTVSE